NPCLVDVSPGPDHRADSPRCLRSKCRQEKQAANEVPSVHVDERPTPLSMLKLAHEESRDGKIQFFEEFQACWSVILQTGQILHARYHVGRRGEALGEDPLSRKLEKFPRTARRDSRKLLVWQSADLGQALSYKRDPSGFVVLAS